MFTFGTLPENEDDRKLLSSISYLKNPSSNTIWLSSSLPEGSYFSNFFEQLEESNVSLRNSASVSANTNDFNSFSSNKFLSLDKASTLSSKSYASNDIKDVKSLPEKTAVSIKETQISSSISNPNTTSEKVEKELTSLQESSNECATFKEGLPSDSSVSESAEPVTPKPIVKSWASLVGSNATSKTASKVLSVPTVTPSVPTAQTFLVGESIQTKNITHKGKSIPEVFGDIHVSMRAPLFEARGIQNDNLLCYAHSILQALVHCPPFFNILKLLSPASLSSSFEETPILKTMIEFVKFFRTSKKSRNNRGLEAIEPKNIYQLIQNMKSCFSTQIGYQEDAHEFFSALINGLNDEFLTIFKKESFNINHKFDESNIPSVHMFKTEPPNSPITDDDNEWISIVPGNKTCIERDFKELHSPITALFSGVYRHTLTTKGKPTSVSHDSSIYLQLEVEPSHIKTLEDSFEHLLKPEALEKSDLTDSQDKPVISKILTFNSLPPILVLHLKNVVYCMEKGPRKVHKDLSYPLELTIPNSHFSNHSTASLKYQLMAVVYHHGKNAMAGHYTCDVRRADDSWLFCNDSELKNLLPSEVGTSEHTTDGTPYILFYTRIA